MEILAILCTHGKYSKYLLESVENIIGKQNNIYFIKNEKNIEIKKYFYLYKNILKNIKYNSNVICFLDIYGSDIFKVTCDFFRKNKYNYYIITGFNLTMLIDFCMIREKETSLNNIIKSLESSGKESINILK